MNDYYLEKSNRKNKKYMVHYISPETRKIKTIHFGDDRYQDYTIHKDEERKKRYIARHHKEDFNNLNSASAWAKGLLWNKPSLKSSINSMNKKFNIKIHLIN